MPTGSLSRCGGSTTATTLAEEAISDTQLLAFYRLSESSGTTAADSGPGALHLTASGTPVWGGAAGPPGEQTAVFAADWSATRATGFASLAASDMSAEVWVKRTAHNFLPAVGQGNPISSSDGWALGAFDTVTQAPGYGFLYVGNGIFSNNFNGTVTPVTVGPWWYLATTKISDVWRLYVNGAQEPGSLSKATNVDASFWIALTGAFGTVAQESYVVIRSRGLSSAEVLANYHLAVP